MPPKKAKKRTRSAGAKVPAASVAVKPRAKLGPPYKIATAREMQAAVDAYFARPDCDYTMTGLALALGYYDKRSLYSNLAREDECGRILMRARLVVENAYERKLSGTSVGGAIFALKNMGWSDQQQLSIGGSDSSPLKIVVEVVHAGNKG